MNSSYKEKIIVDKKFSKLDSFLHKLPYEFEETGNTIYKGRNTIKTFVVDGIHLNVKYFKKPHLINQFAYATFRQSKAKRSYKHAQKLIELGINTPKPIAYIEYSKPFMLKYSFYICEHLEVDGLMRILQTETLEAYSELIVQFAQFTAKLHDLKVFHLDYSSGNILYTEEDKQYTFYLVDLNRMEIGKEIGIKKAANNFRRLWGSDEMLTLFAKEYAKARGFDVDQCVALVFKYRARFWKRFNRQYPDVSPYVGKEKLRIGYDAKRAVQNFTGLGNYSRFIISNMAQFHPENNYYLYTPTPATQKTQKDLGLFSNVTSIVKQGYKPFWRTKGIITDIKEQKLNIYHGLSNELPIGINRIETKTIVTIHDLIFRIHPEFYKMVDRKIYDVKAKYACNNADRIIAVSEQTKKDIVEIYNIDPDKIDVVYQGCSSEFTRKASTQLKELVKVRYNLPDNYLLSVGSIEERKNILLIVKALREVPDIHFVAIGKRKPYTDLVEEYVKEYQLEDRVHIFSDVPLQDLPAIFQQAKIFIYPSIYEGFGIPLLEAQHSGLPVIAATGSCLEEAGGPHSIYINPKDEHELSQQIKRVLEDEQLREYMIKEGEKYVENFSPGRCISALNKVYNKVKED